MRERLITVLDWILRVLTNWRARLTDENSIVTAAREEVIAVQRLPLLHRGAKAELVLKRLERRFPKRSGRELALIREQVLAGIAR